MISPALPYSGNPINSLVKNPVVKSKRNGRKRFSVALVFCALMGASPVLFSGCATISKDECVAGNWSDLGYRDGIKGVGRDRIADYVAKCSEYDQEVDRQSYLSSFETGLSHYCVYDKGYDLGEGGGHYNAVCEGEQAADFRSGYNDGFADYEIGQEYDRYQNEIESLEDEITDVSARLRDPDLTEPAEKKRLQQKKERLQDDLSDIRWEFKRFRRKNNLD